VRAAREIETTQENIQDRLELDEGVLGFQLLTGGNCCSDIFFYLFSSALPMLLNFPFICFLRFYLSVRAIFCFVNPVSVNLDDLSPLLIQISKGLLYIVPEILKNE
jgi:hypothetical protein